MRSSSLLPELELCRAVERGRRLRSDHRRGLGAEPVRVDASREGRGRDGRFARTPGPTLGSRSRWISPGDIDVDGAFVVDAVDVWIEVQLNWHTGPPIEHGYDPAVTRILVDQVKDAVDGVRRLGLNQSGRIHFDPIVRDSGDGPVDLERSCELPSPTAL